MIATLAATTLLAVQQPVLLQRVFRAGDEWSRDVSLTLSSAMGDVLVTLKMSEKTLEVDGLRATVQVALGDVVVRIGENEMPTNSIAPITVRMDNRGFVLNGLPRVAGNNLSFLRYVGVLPAEALLVGKSVPISFESSDPAGTKLSGSVLLEEMKGKTAVIIVKSSLSAPGTSMPIQLSYKAWVDASSGKVKEAEGTVTDVPAMQGLEVSAIQFVIKESKGSEKERSH
ncbi:MAG: hypothetical protein AB1725_07660 [Armatimonadota bacterium]